MNIPLVKILCSSYPQKYKIGQVTVDTARTLAISIYVKRKYLPKIIPFPLNFNKRMHAHMYVHVRS